MAELIKAGILIFNDVEVLDFCGPYEVLSVVRLDESNRREAKSPFDVLLIAEKDEIVTATGGLRVIPDFTIKNHPVLDILIVPGGWGTRTEINNRLLLDWLSRTAGQLKLLTSVCTGAVLLGKAGLLDGVTATTHWKALDWFRQTCPRVNVVADQHVVQSEKIFTSAGISAGIDMTLKIVAHYFGNETAENTALHMEYRYNTENRRNVQAD
jgi:transcriptional regulator GlxA family with amidase domain